MSRPNASIQRNLTLTEELERLEQSITLTLQEIDHNFSKAHRIVTTSILPIVEQYAEQSREVWEGSKFWKQFFESSANVSLSGYEAQPPSEGGQEGTTRTEESTIATETAGEEESGSFATPSSEHIDVHDHRHDDGELDLSSLVISPSHSTPRPTKYTQQRADDDDITSSSIDYPSPYETLHQDFSSIDTPSQMRSMAPSTPNQSIRRRPGNTTTTPSWSPASRMKPSTAKKTGKPADPVLHRVLDKTYRVQATPLGAGGSRRDYFHTRAAAAVTPKSTKSKRPYFDSPLSSPELEPPKLHSEIFSSPLKREGYDDSTLSTAGPATASRPHIPGVSVLTPAKLRAPTRTAGLWDDSDDDLDDDPSAFFGHSPPKTMQFHVPQSKLLKTPAKEASKRIVSDLLHRAGGGDDFTSDFDYSPSLVQRAEGLDDDTF
ncbi:hypothetical protein AJ80_07085 [Polytolypa hystricis UAMH7299]|uniref:DASH complex subunit ASK1 n=1 Tax=Polytolypa hystricis (strain UAMH7299) TaxID=1447883 RepID=A0A2B7XRE2_POLH7|nr:hypothetical protein AJ80_07085 [Polytolypa hystricis UAMH7299]